MERTPLLRLYVLSSCGADAWRKSASKLPRGRRQDQARLAGGQRYEVSYEAKKISRSAKSVKRVVSRAS
jgi:hypothetical protein